MREAARLDHFLRASGLATDVGRRALAALIAAGAVRVNGRRARKGAQLAPGDEVTLAPPAPRVLVPRPAAFALVHVDTDLVAVDKPPGLPSVAGRTAGPSLAAALLARFPEMAAIDARRAAGLAHRLDTGTSGLLLAARHPQAYARLRRGFARKAIAKTYLAVVHGHVAAARRIERALARSRRGGGRLRPARPRDRHVWPAATELTPLAHARDLTLVRLSMRTGVTHQLRVHLALAGHPVVGDRRYGAARAPASPPPSGEALPWHYLHAWAVRLAEPGWPAHVATAFPRHWAPLCTALGWPTTIAPPVED